MVSPPFVTPDFRTRYPKHPPDIVRPVKGVQVSLRGCEWYREGRVGNSGIIYKITVYLHLLARSASCWGRLPWGFVVVVLGDSIVQGFC